MIKATGLTILFCLIGVSASSAPKPQRPAASGQIERGRYLAEDIGMCGECHSPRDSQGNLDHSRWLQGAPTWFTPIHPVQRWAFAAPALAGLPSFSDPDMVNILEKGVTPQGAPIRPPMHVYHMTHEDAMAIVAYLKSLTPAGQ